MKSKKAALICLIIATMILSVAVFAACDMRDGGGDKEYVIQYTDDAGIHEITVKDNKLFSIEVIPQKNGYVFKGLFDAEVGGTQYVSAKGVSLSAFTDKKDMVLYPQFAPKEYTLILDYQGAQVTGGRQFAVSYDSSLPELPKNLMLEHKTFAGWYTKPNCEGVQIADQYGLIPLVSVVNAKNFDTSKETITLYAGFEAETFEVTCCFDEGMDTEVVKVAYDTPISQIVPKARVNGNAPITWSKSKGGEVFVGKVTTDMVLYAVEYAPVIELDANGGSDVNPVVARAGSTIVLPTPTKDMAKFAYWEDMQGNRYDNVEMPSSSVSLKAVWQAKIVFDENGGTEVKDISEKAGTAITLPTPEKDGFIFAGWYTDEKEQYTSATMPANGIMLKAGWYKEKTETVVVYAEDNMRAYYKKVLTMDNDLTIDLSGFLPANFNGTIKITGRLKVSNTSASLSAPTYFRLALFTQNVVVDQYKVCDNTYKLTSGDTFTDCSYSATIKLLGNKIYGAARSYYTNQHDSMSTTTKACGYYVNVAYPDTANLYL